MAKSVKVKGRTGNRKPKISNPRNLNKKPTTCNLPPKEGLGSKDFILGDDNIILE